MIDCGPTHTYPTDPRASLIMDKVEFLKVLGFPKIWEIHDLLPNSYFESAKIEYEKEYGNTVPDGRAEHWRFGAFIFLCRANLSANEIALLIDAAIEDSDKPMAGGVIEELLSRALASEEMLEKACQVVDGNKYYYKSSEQLRKSFRSGEGPYSTQF